MNMTVKTGLVAAALAMLSIPAGAADFPTKPITFLNGAGVGGGVDSYGRVLASVAPDVFYGQPMIVVNKPGAPTRWRSRRSPAPPRTATRLPWHPAAAR